MAGSTSRGFVLVGLVALCVSAGVNILQAQRIRSLMDTQSAPATVIGKKVTAVTGFWTSGGQRQLSLRDNVPTVVYYFSPTCGWCERNWANIQAVAAGAQGRYRIVLVSTSRDTRPYLEARSLERLEAIEGIDDATRRAFGFSATPHTIVVANDGLITHDWRGAFTPRTQRQIEELFGIDLPGLLPARR